MVLQRINAGRGHDPGLSHGTAQPVLPVPRLLDEPLRAGEHRTDRTAEPFGEVDPGRIEAGGIRPGRDAGGDYGVEQPGSVQVSGKPVTASLGCDILDSLERPACASA